MQCPYCKKEMQKGVISGDGRCKMYWETEDKKPGFFDKLNGTCRVSAAKYILGELRIDAFFCSECKKMIFDTDIQS